MNRRAGDHTVTPKQPYKCVFARNHHTTITDGAASVNSDDFWVRMSDKGFLELCICRRGEGKHLQSSGGEMTVIPIAR